MRSQRRAHDLSFAMYMDVEPGGLVLPEPPGLVIEHSETLLPRIMMICRRRPGARMSDNKEDDSEHWSQHTHTILRELVFQKTKTPSQPVLAPSSRLRRLRCLGCALRASRRCCTLQLGCKGALPRGSKGNWQRTEHIEGFI